MKFYHARLVQTHTGSRVLFTSMMVSEALQSIFVTDY